MWRYDVGRNWTVQDMLRTWRQQRRYNQVSEKRNLQIQVMFNHFDNINLEIQNFTKENEVMAVKSIRTITTYLKNHNTILYELISNNLYPQLSTVLKGSKHSVLIYTLKLLKSITDLSIDEYQKDFLQYNIPQDLIRLLCLPLTIANKCIIQKTLSLIGNVMNKSDCVKQIFLCEGFFQIFVNVCNQLLLHQEDEILFNKVTQVLAEITKFNPQSQNQVEESLLNILVALNIKPFSEERTSFLTTCYINYSEYSLEFIQVFIKNTNVQIFICQLLDLQLVKYQLNALQIVINCTERYPDTPKYIQNVYMTILNLIGYESLSNRIFCLMISILYNVLDTPNYSLCLTEQIQNKSHVLKFFVKKFINPSELVSLNSVWFISTLIKVTTNVNNMNIFNYLLKNKIITAIFDAFQLCLKSNDMNEADTLLNMFIDINTLLAANNRMEIEDLDISITKKEFEECNVYQILDDVFFQFPLDETRCLQCIQYIKSAQI
ncbi:hypothetical protein EIN_095600 [Entamoeba invadens IP1]|uniref:Uncharacterized protein n=1 Tax=Entamoeba invadens IP1 TaxID=370355 RepID=A0A0A1U3I1_ENTIV|nr:hypothetical protein EIN_095600 [Entamoeba invadens IP1]ELP87303.1 hypothetical protein EIN_095600 [Entamoeba invadens IP1]|eukprot:XP_004254074.1 hypothetical protein EIN_095600 [Entamoeba invadens IP1]